MRVIVCGGRDYDDYPYVRHFMDDFCDTHGLSDNEYKMPHNITIIHGGAKGADYCVDQWAVVNWVPIEEYRPNWAKYGKAAGPIRNKQMLDKGADYVIAFPGGVGTEHMKTIARRAGVTVLEA